MKIVSLNDGHAWAIVTHHVRQNKSFETVSGINYSARVEGNAIFYRGSDRNNGEEEIITRVEFAEAFSNVQSVENINTNSIKTLVPNSLYRKRTPFIGLLYSSKIIQ